MRLTAIVVTTTWNLASAGSTPLPQPTVSADVAAKLPDKPYWFATHTRSGTADALFVYRLQRTGLEQVLQISNSRVDDMVWLDAHTLFTVETDRDANVITRRIVDGVAQPTVTIPAAAWKVSAKPDIEVRSPDTSVQLTRTKQVWMRRCVAGKRNRPGCTTWHYLRVDGNVPVLAKRPPVGVFDPTRYPAPAVVKAPRDYQVKLATVIADVVSRRGVNKETWKGFTCEGPDGAASHWPSEDPTYDPSFSLAVDKIVWRSAKPPVYEVSGTTINPLDERGRRTETFRGCTKTPLDMVSWLPGGLRAELTTEPTAQWTIWLGEHPVGVLHGSESHLLVAPST